MYFATTIIFHSSLQFMFMLITFSDVVVSTNNDKNSEILENIATTETETSNCWQNKKNCSIKAELWLKHNEINNTLFIDVDCLMKSSVKFGTIENITIAKQKQNHKYEASSSENTKTLFKKYSKNIRKISLNGCYTSGSDSNIETFGLELIPNYENITDVQFEYFQFNNFHENAIHENNRIEVLKFYKNFFNGNESDREIDGKILKNSLKNLKFIRVLNFSNNGFGLIENESFRNLSTLNEMILIEDNLFVDSRSIYNENLKSLAMSVKIIEINFFDNLPPKLKVLNISKSSFSDNQLFITIPAYLEQIKLVEDNISAIAIIDQYHVLEILNLSSNYLKEIILKNCTNLKILDLSNNEFQSLPGKNFFDIKNLIEIYLQNNQLKTLSMILFQSSQQFLSIFDVRNNLLQSILIKHDFVPNKFLKIFTDGNPWNCEWLLDISYRMPKIFETFRYYKFIERINVNGLECVTTKLPITDITLPSLAITQTVLRPSVERKNFLPPVPTQPKISSSEIRRNQRHEAMIVVLFLFIGVAILTFLLYLWIKCQKLFHSSFYRSSAFMSRRQCTSETCDVLQKTNKACSSCEIPVQRPKDSLNLRRKSRITFCDEIPAPVRMYEEKHVREVINRSR